MGPFPWIALGLTVVGAAFFLALAASPQGLAWWFNARTVHGYEQDGIVNFRYHGRWYAVIDPNSNGNGRHNVTMLASDPAGAIAGSNLPTQVIDWGTIVAPLGLAGVALAAGAVRRRRARRYARTASFGQGLDQDVVQRLLEAQRHSASGQPGPRAGGP